MAIEKRRIDWAILLVLIGLFRIWYEIGCANKEGDRSFANVFFVWCLMLMSVQRWTPIIYCGALRRYDSLILAEVSPPNTFSSRWIMRWSVLVTKFDCLSSRLSKSRRSWSTFPPNLFKSFSKFQSLKGVQRFWSSDLIRKFIQELSFNP